MKEIELRIMGGLGNQLYQYATARFIQKKYGAEKITIDVGEYDTYKIRNLEINNIIHNKNVELKKVKSIKNYIYRNVYHVYQKIYRIFFKQRPEQKIFGNKKNKYLCSYVECNLSDNVDCHTLCMYGYFVSAKTALLVKQELMDELYLLDNDLNQCYKELLLSVKKNPCIAVSIRCGEDYLKNSWPICTKEFYQKGIEYIKNNKNNDILIFVFADDLNKVRKEEWFAGYDNVTYVDGLNVCENFELMRNCSDYVCSNSSFSWWGAFLSYSNDSIIVNPNKVFSGDSEEIDKLTFYDRLTLLDYKTGEVCHENCSGSDTL